MERLKIDRQADKWIEQIKQRQTDIRHITQRQTDIRRITQRQTDKKRKKERRMDEKRSRHTDNKIGRHIFGSTLLLTNPVVTLRFQIYSFVRFFLSTGL